MPVQISVSEVDAISRRDESLTLIDVRSPVEFAEVHASCAINFPLDRFGSEDLIRQRNLSEDRAVYVICKSGGRSIKACQLLEAAGLNNVVNVEGGTDRWIAEGLPVTRGVKQKISIQRQVQLCAGSIALLGALLSFVHPAWAVLPAFIGAGQIFSGLTNTCGMGTVLAKMPWNQVALSKAPTTKALTKDKQASDCDSGG